MKKIIACLVAIILLLQFSNAQDSLKLIRPQILLPGKVTKVTVFASPGYMEGCTNPVKHFEFTAVITVSGRCVVQYKWNRNDGGIDSYAPRSLSFATSGTQTVTTTWDLSKTEYEGWQSLTVTAPNTMESNKAVFKINCCKTAGDPCKDNPYTLTACTQSLLTSFKNLATGVGVRICNTTLKFPGVSGTMPENCYSYGKTGIVSYTSFYELERNPAIWRVIWGSDPAQFAYYGVCPPEPIIYPRPGGNIENHVFAARLIKKTDYQAFSGPDKSYNGTLALSAIRIADVTSMSAPVMEESTGHINTAEHDLYDNIYSSKGIVVTVKLKDGSSHACYLLNNYDGAGTVTWKQKNPACEGK